MAPSRKFVDLELAHRGAAVLGALRALVAVAGLALWLAGTSSASAGPLVRQFLGAVTPGDLVPGAEAFGAADEKPGIVPVTKGGRTVGYALLTSDFVPTAGYSGKPIHVVVGLSPEAVITGVRLVKHSEPIVLVGIPEAKIKAVTEKYAGLDLKRRDVQEGGGHDLDIVSGATVTVMVIDDTILHASLKAARVLGLPGVGSEAGTGPTKLVDRSRDTIVDWPTLTGDRSLAHLSVDVGTINQAFAALGDPRAADKAEAGPDDAAYIDVYTGLASQPSIGRSLLGDAEYANLKRILKDGDEAIFVAGLGRWSFKGSGYVRGGIFDRITLVQGSTSYRFHDRDHRKVVRLGVAGAPDLAETDLFIVPKSAGFDPAAPWRLQMLVQRPVGPIEKLFLTYELGYALPAPYLLDAPRPVTDANAPAAQTVAAAAGPEAAAGAARDRLWLKIWEAKRPQIIVLGVALALLTGIFFFQTFATRNARAFAIVRNAYLVFTLVFVGWYANAQLSVVNVLAVLQAFVTGFHWDTFLMDPLIFVLWFAVAAALLFWARGAYCGWLCPFGALQELSNKIARALHVPQITLPWGLHERLWPVKYMIFLGLLGLSFYSFDVAEHYAEVEPFKTAIILKFDRPWPYVLFALAMLAPGLFIERFYCRYVCPLGGGLAIPARLHMFRWLKRYSECGSPCQTCANDCPVQAIHPTGEINPNECISCLNCQVLYQSKTKCPVVIGREKKRQRFEAQNGLAAAASNPTPSRHPGRPVVTHTARSAPDSTPAKA